MADLSLRPLVPAEEAWLAGELADGRRPFVHVLAASADLPAGARARVQTAGPVSEGEYLIVEVKGDRLPFAAPELALPPAVARRVRKAAGVVDPPPKARRVRAAPSPAKPAKAVAPKAVAPKVVAPKAALAKSAKPVPPKPATTTSATTTSAPTKPAATRSAPARATRRRPPTPIAVTINFDGVARWTVEARAGSRRVRPVEIGAGAAAAASDALGVPEVDALVTAITDAMRRDAEERTEGLRAQLAAAEAELARLSR
ncbi:MAG: hypothetical protein QOG52_2361 [Frankiaceae bacterium]|nr:hypothetical protein [Frankiaceae bacterium]